ncbi:LuxR C-terminal-related transcriptional regulator [Streptosporangium sp. NPDC001681]|uniref:helix-turn-helix transcriptional regulator n=1 Tax=Streptosporangium sp. NPDC001681 TaxID=3154395 RepID=UPI003320314B
MDDDVEVRTAIDKLLPERLRRLQRVTGVPVVFGGYTRPAATKRQLVLSRLVGTLGDSLRGLAVDTGRGLGGSVLHEGSPRRVNDYATTTTITHDYDRIVVEEERITSVFAVPVVVRGVVHSVMYGAVRDPQPIGDRALNSAGVVAAQMQQDVEDLLRPGAEEPHPGSAHAAIAELADVVRSITDPALLARLARIHRALVGPGVRVPATITLAQRERDVLSLAAVGASNVEIAARLGLSPQTVKAYMRTAMSKLGVHNRTAAVHAARQAGAL